MSSADLMVQVALANWKLTIGRADKVFGELSDAQFYQEIAPGRNRPVYLLGHLTAVHDLMHTLLGIGDRLHPELDTIFLTRPDKTVDRLPSLVDLKTFWADVNTLLIARFNALTAEQWLQRHTAMTDEDYAKDPTRNRFNILLNRTNHTGLHLGQLRLAHRD